MLAGRAAVVIGGVSGVAELGDAIVVPPDTSFELTNDGDAILRLLCCFAVGGQGRMNGETFAPPWAQ